MVSCNILKEKFSTISTWNVILTAIYIGLIIFVVLYFDFEDRSNTSGHPINLSTYYHSVEYDMEPHTVESVIFRKITPNTIKIMLLIISSVSTFIHFISALNINNIYSSSLIKRNNWLRWINFSVSYSIINIILAVLLGMKDVSSLSFLLLISIAIVLLLWHIEMTYLEYEEIKVSCSHFEYITNSQFFIPIILLIILFAGSWILMFTELYQKIIDFEKSSTDFFPRWLILTSMSFFLLYLLAGIIIIKSYMDKSDYLSIDKIYTITILLSNIAITLITYYGFKSYE